MQISSKQALLNFLKKCESKDYLNIVKQYNGEKFLPLDFINKHGEKTHIIDINTWSQYITINITMPGEDKGFKETTQGRLYIK